LKHHLAAYNEVEEKIVKIVFSKFGLTMKDYAGVAEQDLKALATEFRDVMGQPFFNEPHILPAELEIEPLKDPLRAKAAFLERFAHLIQEKE
jgi:hypothetical protein